MKPTPAGWPRISSSVFYVDAPAAIDFLSHAFGFEVRLKIEGEGGRIEHSELTFGEGLIMVGTADAKAQRVGRDVFASPAQLGERCTQALCIFVDDVDAQFERAKAAGARVIEEPKTTDYGAEYWTDRSCMLADPEGHRWWFMQRLRGATQSG
jgi:uncharacterized glyoxalase superfamily protein PhnB